MGEIPSFFAALWVVCLLANIIIGAARLYEIWQERTTARIANFNPTQRFVRFVITQVVLMMRHPKQVFITGGLTAFFPMFTICLVLWNRDWLDLAEHAWKDRHDEYRREFEREHRMVWKICSEWDARAYDARKQEYLLAEERAAEFVHACTMAMCKIGLYVVLGIGVITAPFGAVQAAFAKTGNNRTVAERTLSDVHGAFMVDGVLTVPTSGAATTAATPVRKAVVFFAPHFGGGAFDGLLLADLTGLANGKPASDPVLMASLTWHATSTVLVSAGRLLNPVGFGRNPPPQAHREIAYAPDAITAPLFDNGVLVSWTPNHQVHLTGGVLSGEGIDAKPNLPPNVVLQLDAHPVSSWLIGLDTQTGYADSTWRQATGLHTALQLDRFSFAGELQTQPDNLAMSYWATVAYTWPTDGVETYVGVRGIHNIGPPVPGASWDPSGIIGVNWALMGGIALRAVSRCRSRTGRCSRRTSPASSCSNALRGTRREKSQQRETRTSSPLALFPFVRSW